MRTLSRAAASVLAAYFAAAVGLYGSSAVAQAKNDFKEVVVRKVQIDQQTKSEPTIAKTFTFDAVIGKLVTTAKERPDSPTPGPATTKEKTDLVQSIIDTFIKKGGNPRNPWSLLPTPLDDRPGEAGLVASALLKDMLPVALFNRFDQAPDSYSDCGEHRIVYAMKPRNGERFFLIFEAGLPNPEPDKGLEGCGPVVKFWIDLASAPDADTRAQKLREFYFEGIPGSVPTKKFRPVIHIGNFGSEGLGQLRGNIFVRGKWQLGEWHALPDPNSPGRVTFVIDTVNNNPLPEFYAKKFSVTGLSKKEQEEAERIGASELPKFQSDFLHSYVANLLAIKNGSVPTDRMGIINGLALKSDKKYDEFQSTSQGTEDDPRVFIKKNAAFEKLIVEKLAELQKEVDADKRIDVKHLMNRAAAGTCAGCHQTAAKAFVAPGVQFPDPVRPDGFVHVREDGTLSPALENDLLLFRQEELRKKSAQLKTDPKSSIGSGPFTKVPDVQTQLKIFLEEPSLDGRLKLAAEVAEAVKKRRAEERAKPGAVVPNRRPH